MNDETTKVCSKEGCENPRHNTKSRTAWCTAHIAEYNKEWRKKNPEKAQASRRAWRENNPEKVREANRRYEAKYTKEERQERLRASHVRHSGEFSVDPSGYTKVRGLFHPACSPCGITRYARIVLWDKLNGKDAPVAADVACEAGCGRILSWYRTLNIHGNEAVTVEHLNGIKDDDRPENLAAYCNECNNRAETKNKGRKSQGDAA